MTRDRVPRSGRRPGRRHAARRAARCGRSRRRSTTLSHRSGSKRRPRHRSPCAADSGRLHVRFGPRPATVAASEMRAIVAGSRLPQACRARALDALDRLIAAEAAVHGVRRSEVVSTSSGSDDTLVDICGAFTLLDALAIERLVCSPAPARPRDREMRRTGDAASGAGDARRARRRPGRRRRHARRARDPDRCGDRVATADAWGELPRWCSSGPARRRNTRARRPPELIRVVIGDASSERQGGTDVALLEANLDDLVPELVPDVARAMHRGRRDRRLDGPHPDEEGPARRHALRPRPPRARAALAERSFRDSTTLGVRVLGSSATSSTARIREVEIEGGAVRVKIGLARRPGRERRARARRLRGRRRRDRQTGKVRLGRSPRGRHHSPGRPGCPHSLSSRPDRQPRRARSSRSPAASTPLWSRRPPPACWVSGPRVTAVSPALATGELDGAARSPRAVGIAHARSRPTSWLAKAIDANGADRCYHCKSELYDRSNARRRRGFAAAFSGANVDDLGDWRPGLRAAAEHDVRHPLLEAGLRKETSASRSRARDPERRQARDAVPRLPPPVRHRGRPPDARADRPRRVGDQGPRLSRPPRASPRRPRQGRARR